MSIHLLRGLKAQKKWYFVGLVLKASSVSDVVVVVVAEFPFLLPRTVFQVELFPN